jgi:hypothetical protein
VTTIDPLIPVEAKALDFPPAERCRLVASIIEEHPERHDQSTYWGADVYEMDGAPGRFEGMSRWIAQVGCGTAACAAGWTVASAHLDLIRSSDMSGEAARLLNIGDELGAELFETITSSHLAPGERARFAAIFYWIADTQERLGRTVDLDDFVDDFGTPPYFYVHSAPKEEPAP